MTIPMLFVLFAQSSGDTLRWYDTTTAGYTASSYGGGPIYWAIILPIDSNLDGRTVHSGRVMIWDTMDSSGTMKLSLGDHDGPKVLLDLGSFRASDSLSFCEVFFGDSIIIHQGDTIWLWCDVWDDPGEYHATNDAGPAVRGFGDWVSPDGIGWSELWQYGFDYNWVMELILTPSDVEEGPARPEEKLTLLPAPGGFWITGYSGEAQVYDPAGRLVLKKEINGKTLIGPLRPGIYFVVAGRQRARIAVR